MHSLVTMLESVRDFYLSEVLSTTQLQRPTCDERLNQYELVQPAAHIAWIPPGGALEATGKVTLPCIVVGLDQRSSSDEETEVWLRITAAVYDPGHQTQDAEGHLNNEPDFAGYLNLLNLLDRLEAATLKNQVIGGCWQLSSPVETKMYEEQPWPYWYGYLRFALTGPAYPQTRYKL